MSPEKWILLAVNVIGGSAVIGSYLHGLLTHPGRSRGLWGGIPRRLINFYTAGMFLAAAGYFLFIYFLLFRLNPADTLIAGYFDYNTYAWIFALILLPSALWMPLTFSMLDKPGTGIWMVTRIVLALVGLGAIALTAALLLLEGHQAEPAYWLAVGGSVLFSLQTAVLDAIIWPAYWPL